MSSETSTLTLNNGERIPQIGFGVWQVTEEETEATVAYALEAGYRHIDTATIYRNEAGVGKAVAASALPRDEIYVTTKLWNTEQGYESTLRAFDHSLTSLGLDYLDLYLIHWPMPKRDTYLETWRAFEKLHAEGLIKSIGVSNFEPDHLQRIIDLGGTVPAVNQIELHPALTQEALRTFHDAHGIVTVAWSPLARSAVLEEPTIVEIAERLGKSPAQVILAWHLALGNVAIPKSVTPARIVENLDVADIELNADDIARITGLERGGRTGPDPLVFT
ncbi:MAG: 2,5-didehydrogluconate reductase [Nocardioidaceae bacterium]|nr:2,5-didehydrogluconate reductase [Nocardioidaceae bacterium]